MRLPTIILLTIMSFSVSGQRLIGNYNAYYGYSLELRDDSTFKYEWRFDMMGRRAFGHWRYSDKIVSLTFLYDTLSQPDRPDSLVLSHDEKSTRISQNDFAMSLVGTSRHNHEGITNKLVLRRGKLYQMDESGNIITKKYPGIWNTRKRSTRYFKVD